MKSELIQAFIVVLVTCKNEKDPIKNSGSRVLTRSPRNKYGDFFKRSRAANSAVYVVKSGRNFNSFKTI